MVKISQICGNGHITPLEVRASQCSCGKELKFEILEDFDFPSLIDKNIESMWRFHEFLPVGEENIVTANEGNTPIVHMKDIGDKLGINLYTKLETDNPTGTFKDREASFVVSRSKDIGEDNLVLQSTGNTAISVTYYSGLAGLSSFAFIPAISKYKLSIPDKKNKNRIIAVFGSPQEVKKYAEKFAKIHKFPKISPFHERCECNATQAYEVYEQVLTNKIPMPDFYIQVISAGMGPIGFFHGAKRVKEKFSSIKIPRIVCVQNSEFSPMNKALKEDKETLGEEYNTPNYLKKNPYEPTLHTTNARSYYPHLRNAIKYSNGLFPVITPEFSRRYKKELSDSLENLGVKLAKTENAPFITYAGLVSLVESREIKKGSNVLLVITGKGDIGNYIEPDAIISPDHDPNKLFEQLKRNE